MNLKARRGDGEELRSENAKFMDDTAAPRRRSKICRSSVATSSRRTRANTAKWGDEPGARRGEGAPGLDRPGARAAARPSRAALRRRPRPWKAARSRAKKRAAVAAAAAARADAGEVNEEDEGPPPRVCGGRQDPRMRSFATTSPTAYADVLARIGRGDGFPVDAKARGCSTRRRRRRAPRKTPPSWIRSARALLDGDGVRHAMLDRPRSTG